METTEIKLDSTKDLSVNISEDVFTYLQNSIDNFNIINLKVNTSLNENNFYQIYYSYSYDKINYADFKLLNDFQNPDNINIPVYIAIYFKKIESTDLQKPLTLYQQKNINSDLHEINLNSIKYDTKIYDLKSETDIKYITLYKIINQYPKWNLYDNQQININRWLQQINAISEMYGHTCIYFKQNQLNLNLNKLLKIMFFVM